MAFVKIVGGSEIYNFHIVHFYSSFWRYLCPNIGLAAQNGSAAPCAATSRRNAAPLQHAFGVRARAPPEAGRNPRPCSF
jgi:hypothetical protein